jgi:hypothetical protein
VVLLKGTDQQLVVLSDLTEILELIEKFKIVQSAEATSADSQEASLVFDLTKDVEDRLEKQLEIFSIVSDVELLINENCLKAKASKKKKITDILEVICSKFAIPNKPCFSCSTPRKDGRKKEKNLDKSILGRTIKEEKLDGDLNVTSETDLSSRSCERSAASDENSSYVMNLLASIVQNEETKTTGSASGGTPPKSKAAERSKKAKKPILFPDHDNKSTVSHIQWDFGIIESENGKVIFHKGDIYDADGNKVSMLSMEKGMKVQFQDYEASTKIKDLCSKLEISRHVKRCAQCVYLGPEAPIDTGIKSRSRTLKDMEDALQEWCDIRRTNNEAESPERRIIRIPVSQGTPCQLLDPDLAKKVGPCKMYFNFDKCAAPSCKFAHALPEHMELKFCRTGNLGCDRPCPLKAGELNQNYAKLLPLYKQEITRLKRDCKRCGKERIEEEYYVVDEYSAEDSDESDSEDRSPEMKLEEITATENLIVTTGENAHRTVREVDSGVSMEHSSTSEKKPCKYHKQGKGFCSNGNKCKFLHEPAADLRNRLRRKSAEINKNLPDLRQERLGSRSRRFTTRAKVVTVEDAVLDRNIERSVRCRVVDDYLKMIHVRAVSTRYRYRYSIFLYRTCNTRDKYVLKISTVSSFFCER